MSKQLYNKGDRVRIVNIGWPMWESDGEGEMKVYDTKPELIGREAIILGSYDDLYPSKMVIRELNADGSLGEVVEKEQNGSIGYSIEWVDGGSGAWYHEYQLEPADKNTPREEQQHYPHWKDSPTGKFFEEQSEKLEAALMWGRPME